jgi:hypothetical protein
VGCLGLGVAACRFFGLGLDSYAASGRGEQEKSGLACQFWNIPKVQVSATKRSGESESKF